MFRIPKLKAGRKNSTVKTETDQSSAFDYRFSFPAGADIMPKLTATAALLSDSADSLFVWPLFGVGLSNVFIEQLKNF